MGFAINAARSVPDLYCLCSHCGILPKNFDKPSIATEKSFCNSKSVHSRSKQCLRIYKDHFCVAKCLLGNPKPLNYIRWMQATRFLQNAFLGLRRSVQPSRNRDDRKNLAVVRTKALLATVMVLRMRLRNFSFALQTGWHFCIIGSMNTRIKSEGLSD